MASKFDIAREFRAGYAGAIALQSLGDDRSEHWRAGWNVGYRSRMMASEAINSYLGSIGLEPMEVMTLAESEPEVAREVDSKEAFYDAGISPIIDTVISRCNEAKIAFLMSFDLGISKDEDSGEERPIACTSLNIEAERKPFPLWEEAVRRFDRGVVGS